MNTSALSLILIGLFAALASVFIFSALPILAKRYQRKYESNVSDKLHSAFVFLDSRQLFFTQMLFCLTGIGLLWFFTKQLVVVGVFAIFIGSLPTLTLSYLKSRRSKAFRAQLPDALMVVASSMRSGTGLAMALNHVAKDLNAPIAQEIELVLRQCRLGLTLPTSMQQLEKRFPSEELSLFVAAIHISQETGGNLAETLEGLAGAIRTKMQIEGKLDALTAQGKMQGVIVGLLPFAVLLMIMLIEPTMLSPLFSTAQGWVACTLVVVLELLGGLFIRRIVRIDI
jgi:tight adherence protein B